MIEWTVRDRETDAERDKDYVEKEFQLAWVKLDGSGEGVREVIEVGCFSILILDEAELKSAWSVSWRERIECMTHL